MFFAKSHQAYRRSRRLPVRFTVCDQCFPRPASFGTSLLALHRAGAEFHLATGEEITALVTTDIVRYRADHPPTAKRPARRTVAV